MEDFFKYLVVIIFVISFLNSLFKKKPSQLDVKKPLSPDPWSPNRESAPVYLPPEAVDANENDYAIQKEIEKMFGKETPVVKPELPAPSIKYSSPETTAYAVSIPEGYSGETKKEQVSEITQLLDKKTKTEEAARRFRESINEKLHHPESLKDYIIISEILGKPKAFE